MGDINVMFDTGDKAYGPFHLEKARAFMHVLLKINENVCAAVFTRGKSGDKVVTVEVLFSGGSARGRLMLGTLGKDDDDSPVPFNTDACPCAMLDIAVAALIAAQSAN